MSGATYQHTRGKLEQYFDRTAIDAWRRLTSYAPVGRIRATVRAGRDDMRATLLSLLPTDLRGRRVLDAGCGSGALAVEAARRGADVVAVDLSPRLISIARDRTPDGMAGRIDFRVGDMLDASLGRFDHVVAMDSLIHYHAADIVRVLAGFSARAQASILFTYAPRTPALAAMHAVGRLLPRGDRAPAIQPVASPRITHLIAREPHLAEWAEGRTRRISTGFYKSQALELFMP